MLAPVKPKRPLHQGFWLLCLPLACGYQLAWALFFTLLFDYDLVVHMGMTTEAQISAFISWLLPIKLISELMLYSGMLYYLYRYTYTQHRFGYYLASSLLISVMLMTLFALIY